MATSLTRNLKLRINSNLTADAKYNLERLDLLGSTFLVDSTNTLNIRSQTDILIEPNSADLAGSGIGGTVSIGTANHKLASIALYSDSLTISAPLGLADQATGGTKQLNLKYKSDLNGSVDNAADRNLSIDVDGADRSLVLEGDLGVLGGSLTLNLSGATSLSLPTSGVLSTLAGTEILTNKTINAVSNTISNIANSNIAAGAAISYSKLALTGSILNADINAAAAIAYSKLSLNASILNSDISASAGISYSKLALSGSIVNTDVSSSAAIQYSKLNLSSSLVDADVSSTAAIQRSKLAAGSASQVLINDSLGRMTSEAQLSGTRGGTGVSSTAVFPTSGTVLTDSNTATLSNKSISGSSNTLSNIAYASLLLSNSIVNTDINASAAIAYSKLNLASSILNSDISASAAIAGTKISPDFGNQLIRTLDGLQFEEGGYTTTLRAAQSGQSTNITFLLPSTAGSAGQVLSNLGSGEMAWATISGTGTVTSVALATPAELSVSGSPITTAGTITLTWANQSANKVFAGPATGAATTPGFRSLVKADLPALTTDDITEGSNLYFTNERVDDRVAALLVAGTSISISYNDPANTLTITNTAPDQTVVLTNGAGISITGTYPNFTIASTITQYTDEMAQDAVGTILTDSTNIHFTYNDAGNTISANVIAGSLTNTEISASAAIAYSKLNLTGSIVNADISASAAIALSKLASLGNNFALQSNGSGVISVSAVTSTELGYVSGVTSAIQTQLNGKQATGNYITALSGDVVATGPGAVTATIQAGAIDNSKVSNTAAITYSKLALSNSIVNADINSAAAIAYSKLNLTGSIVNADVASGAAIAVNKLAALTASRAVVTDGSGFVSAATTTSTEIGYVNGVTSAIQTQIDGKQPLDSDLTAVAGLTTTGIMVRTGTGTAATRTLVAGTGISLTNANGVAGDITINSTATVSSFKATWLTADGTTKVVTHSLATTDIMVQVFDVTTGQTIEVDTATRTDANTLTLVASQAPASSWRVLILAL